MSIDKTVATAAEAVADIRDGASIAVGGFGLSGNPMILIAAILDSGAKDLSIVSNNCGVDDWGLGVLLKAHRIGRMTSSYAGEKVERAASATSKSAVSPVRGNDRDRPGRAARSAAGPAGPGGVDDRRRPLR